MLSWKVLLRLVRGPRCVPIQQRAVGGVSAAKDGENRWKRMEFDEQSATGFENVSMLGLLRAAVVVRLSASDYISNNAITLMHQAKRLVGKRLFDVLMRGSFYGHFCVGERREEIEKSTTKLFQNNVRPMLLVTIEEESRDNNASKRDIKLWFENNKKVILECIETCNRTQQDLKLRYIHFRLSALLPSKVLTKITKKLEELRPRSLDENELDPESDFINFQSILENRSYEEVLDADECELLLDGMEHFEEVAERSERLGNNVLVDAEFMSFNPAIRAITHVMMSKFNTTRPVLQHTFQGYLTCSLKEIEKSLELCRKYDIYFGAKIVRGAYMVMERHLAFMQGVSDPICKDKAATDKSYDRIVATVIEQIGEQSKIQLMVACHNEDSINRAIETMKRKSIDPQSGKVIFGQTYGLSDYITNWLGSNNFIVFKSTPIGSIEDTLPYLHRRAQENKAALDFRMDRMLISRELRRRLRFRATPSPPS